MTTDRTEERPLPDGWTWTTGKNLFKWASGKNLPQKKMREGSVPVFGGNGIGGFHDESLIDHPTLVIGRVGAHCGNVHLTRGASWITDNAIYARELSDAISLKFAQIAFQLAKLNEQATGSGQPFVNQRMLNEVEFPLPPFPEQERIVAEIEKQFTRLDQAVASLRRLQSNLARYKASVLKAACEGRLVPQDPNDEPAADLLARILAERRAQWQAANPGKKYKEPVGVEETAVLPDGWVWASLEQMSGLITSGSRGWSKYYADSGATFIRAQDINTDSLNLDSVAYVSLPNSVEGTRSRVDQHDLLVTITGANVTKTALVRQNLDEAYISQHVGLVKPVLGKTSEYLYYWVVSPTHGRAILEKDAYGAGKPGLNLGNLRELRIGLPPLAEQERIVAEVERRLSVVTAVEQTITANLSRAERLRQSILHRAFTGQLV